MQTPLLFVRPIQIALALCLGATVVSAQGPLTPGGIPGPSMKTLEQIEPRKELNQTNTPGDSGNVFRITAPGSY